MWETFSVEDDAAHDQGFTHGIPGCYHSCARRRLAGQAVCRLSKQAGTVVVPLQSREGSRQAATWAPRVPAVPCPVAPPHALQTAKDGAIFAMASDQGQVLVAGELRLGCRGDSRPVLFLQTLSTSCSRFSNRFLGLPAHPRSAPQRRAAPWSGRGALQAARVSNTVLREAIKPRGACARGVWTAGCAPEWLAG